MVGAAEHLEEEARPAAHEERTGLLPPAVITGGRSGEFNEPNARNKDEKKWLELKELMDRAVLRAHPLEEFGKKYQCDNCLFYLDNDAELSYCWHPNLRILVGADWWCQWWERVEE